jgi:hypothetical protein
MNMKAVLIAGGISFLVGLLFTLFNFIPCLGTFCCLALLLVYPLAGVLYGFLAKRDGALTVGSGLLGGAICGGLAGVATGVVYGITALAMGSQDVLDVYSQMDIQLPPEMVSTMQSPMIMPLTAAILLCGSVLIAAVLGAIGGLIYSAIAQSKPAQQ